MHRQQQAGERPSPERGTILVAFAVSLVAMMLVVGLTIDLGSAYIDRASLARAVDAGALAAARSTGGTPAKMKKVALGVAKSNYWKKESKVHYTVKFRRASDSGRIIEVKAKYKAPAYFSRLFGNKNFPIAVVGKALRSPLGISVVLQASDTFQSTKALDQVKQATEKFLDQLNENVDRVGIVSFATIASKELRPQKGFVRPAERALEKIKPLVESNMEEGLRQAKDQLDKLKKEKGIRRIVLLITDARVSAFRDVFYFANKVPKSFDGIVAANTLSGSYRGLFEPKKGKKVVGFKKKGKAVLSSNDSSKPSPKPASLPGGQPVQGRFIRQVARTQAEQWASALRASGVTIYCLGVDIAVNSFELPDRALLRRIANVDAATNAAQPAGKVFWASPDKLSAQLDLLAQEIIVTRLTR